MHQLTLFQSTRVVLHDNLSLTYEQAGAYRVWAIEIMHGKMRNGTMLESLEFDDLIRSERYFTATLLPAVLFHNNLEGIRQFFELVDSKATTECNKFGKREPKGIVNYRDFHDVQLITEFHIRRDLKFAGLPIEQENPGKRDAPDVVIIAGDELLVCEGKFFSEFDTDDLDEQLRSQRCQVSHLFNHRPHLRAYRHVAMLPFLPIVAVDADVVLTWDDIRVLSERLLGSSHYVTLRLRNAVERYNVLSSTNPVGTFYDGKLTFEEMREKCEQAESAIWVGYMGGASDLRKRSLDYAKGRKWKYRTKTTPGNIIEKNWLPALRWLEVVDDIEEDSIN